MDSGAVEASAKSARECSWVRADDAVADDKLLGMGDDDEPGVCDMSVTDPAGELLAPLAPRATGNLYLQLAGRLRTAITSGVYRPGDPLPSEHQLRAMFGVSRPTVRRAIDILANEGLLVRRHGMGTFVAKLSIEQPMGRVIGFSERMRRLGIVPTTRVLEIETVHARQADPAAAQAFDLQPGDRLIRLSRVRFANDDAVVLETSHLPEARFAGLAAHDLAHESLYAVLREHFGVAITFIREILEPVILSASEAALLRTQPGTPGMLARIVTFDQHGQPVEHSLSLVRGDRCQYEIAFAPTDLHPGGAGWHIRQTQLEVGPGLNLP